MDVELDIQHEQNTCAEKYRDMVFRTVFGVQEKALDETF